MPVPETTHSQSDQAAETHRPNHLWVVPPDGHPEAPQPEPGDEPAPPSAAGDEKASDEAGAQAGQAADQADGEVLAPWDVRALAALERLIAASPSWQKQPPSLAQSFEYSKQGDWASHPSKSRRYAHLAVTAIVFGLTGWCDLIIAYRFTAAVRFLLVCGFLFLCWLCFV